MRRMLLAAVRAARCCRVRSRRRNAALPLTNPPTFTFTNDENGADDQPGQKDLSAHSGREPGTG